MRSVAATPSSATNSSKCGCSTTCASGEAVRVVKPQLAGAHPDIPWSSIVGMRNILVHHYFAVDTDLIWRVVENELAPLKQSVAALLAQIEH